MKRVAFIFCRGGSKGLPGKNIRPLLGKPLIGYSIEFALNSGLFDDVIVSTDDKAIAETAKKFGAKVPFMRPAEFATDTAPEMLAWRHAIDFYRKNFGDFSTFVSLPAVSPIRNNEDFQKGLALFESGKFEFVISAVESEANPYFNLFEVVGDEFQRSKTSGKIIRRQDAPKVLRIVPSYYFCHPDTPSKFNTVLEGKIGLFEIPKDRGFDIDTRDDFDYMEYVLSRK